MYMPNHYEVHDKVALNDKARYKEDFSDMFSLLLGLLSTSGIYPKFSLDYNKGTLIFDVDNKLMQIQMADLYGIYTYADYQHVKDVITINLSSWTTYSEIYRLANAIFYTYTSLKKSPKTT